MPAVPCGSVGDVHALLCQGNRLGVRGSTERATGLLQQGTTVSCRSGTTKRGSADDSRRA